MWYGAKALICSYLFLSNFIKFERMLVICIIMLFSAYTQSIRQKAEAKKKGLEIFEKMN